VEKRGPDEYLAEGGYRSMTVNVGDVVFYQKFAGTWVQLAGREVLMLLEDEVQARLPAGTVTVVSHTDEVAQDLERRLRALEPERGISLSAFEHLEGEPCLICSTLATIETREAEATSAKANLEAMRAEFVQSTRTTAPNADEGIPGVLYASE